MTASTMITMITIVPTPINMGGPFLMRPPRGTELFNSTTQTGPGEPSGLCWPVLKGTPASKGRLGFAGKIFDAVPERAVLLQRDAHLLGSRIIALPGG